MAAVASRKAKHSKLDAVHINLGLHQVFPDPEDNLASRDLNLDIVAVPGLGANPEFTWIRDKSHWLRDGSMLGRKVPNARISVFQYQSQWFGKGSIDQQLDNVVDQLLYELQRTRGDDCKTPIIFVCHCLGGIILERTILASRLRQNTFPSIFPWITGCVFLGTPFNGTRTSDKARVLANMAETFGMGVQTSLLKLLEKDSETLKRMLDDFVKLTTQAKIRVFCFFESQKSSLSALFIKGFPYKAQELIVDKDSATFPGVECLQLAADHFSLNKYSGPKDGNFVSVSNEIQTSAKKAPLILKSRQNALRQKLISNRTYHAIMDELAKGFSDIESTVKGNYKGPSTKERSWILDVEKYTTWKKQEDSKFLWIHGEAGTGQGAIASAVIEDLAKADAQNNIVASFFCDQGEENRRTLKSLLKLVIRQIINVNQDLAVHLLTDARAGKKTGSQEYDSEALSKVPVLWETLSTMARDFSSGQIYIVLHGIDQLSKEALDELFTLLETLSQESQSKENDEQQDVPKIQWMLLSRAGRSDVAKKLTDIAQEINLSNQQNALQVSRALRADISARVDDLQLTPSLAYFAKRHIHSRAEDNYIYVSLVIQELRNAKISGKTSHADVRHLLESFPYGLTNMFEHIQKRVLKEGSEGLEYTKEILRCGICAINAPSLRAMAIMAGLPREDWNDYDKLKQYIVRCGAFFTLREAENDEGNYFIEWIDISAQEHLKKYAKDALSLDLLDVQHGIIALRCLEYVYENTEAYQAYEASKKPSEDDEENQEDADSEVTHDEYGGLPGPASLANAIVPYGEDNHDDIQQQMDANITDVTDTQLTKPGTDGDNDDNDADDDDDDDDGNEDEDEEDAAAFDGVAYPFEYWLDHAKNAPKDVLDEIRLDHSFWGDESVLREDWWSECEHLHPFDEQKNVTPLHVAAIARFPAFAEYLLDNGRSHYIHMEDSFGYQPLFYAAMNGELKIVEMLLGALADPNFIAPTNDTSALLNAAANGHKDVVECLLNCDAEINSASVKWGTALYAAVEDAQTDMVKYLLERGAKVNLEGGWHKNALNVAAYNGFLESVQLLLDHGADIDPDLDYLYGSALGAAARRGHADIVKLLISKGWSPNRNIGTYGSFLTAAATYGHVNVVEALVQREARITVLEQALQASSQNGKAAVVKAILDRTPTLRHQKAFMLAADFGRDDVLELLYPRGIAQEQLNTALYRAADYEHESTVRLLLQFGADPNAEGLEYGTALTASAYDGTTGILEALLEKGADVNKRGGEYGTALQAAGLYGDVGNLELLLNHGAEVNTEPNGIYGNPLQAACYSGDQSTIEKLLEAGADVNAYGGHYKYAIIAAVKENDIGTIRLLLEHHANVNVRGGEDNMPVIVAAGATLQSYDIEMILDHGADINAHCDRGTTALIQCAYASDSTGVETLVSRGADVNIVSETIGGALHAAAAAGSSECCDALLKAGADVNAVGGHWATALQAAASKGEYDVVETLCIAGADVDIIGGEFGSALQAASFSGDIYTVTNLLDHGAIIDWPGGNGVYGFPLQAGAVAGHKDVLELLIQRGSEVNAVGGVHGHAILAAASKRGNDDCIQYLLECGADATFEGGQLGSTIQAAAYGNNFGALEPLLSHGANINSTGGKYGSALQAASVKTNLEFVEFLLARGADVSFKGGKYYTALQAAAYADKLDVVNKLLDQGADFRLRGGQYTNAITAAAVKGNKAVLDRFLSMGPPEQMLDEALVESCYHRQSASVETLLKSGANVYARHPTLGLPIDALRAEQPDGYNSDDEVDSGGDQETEDDDAEEEEEDETWEGDGERTVDGAESEGSVTDLKLEDEVTEQTKIEKLLDEAMARVKRNPSVKRFKTVRRKGVPSSLVAGPPMPQPAVPANNNYSPYNQAVSTQGHGRRPVQQQQGFEAYPGTGQHHNTLGHGGHQVQDSNYGYTPYRNSVSEAQPSSTPPSQYPVSMPPSRRPVPQRFSQSQPEQQYSAGPPGYNVSSSNTPPAPGGRESVNYPSGYVMPDQPMMGSPGNIHQPQRQSSYGMPMPQSQQNVDQFKGPAQYPPPQGPEYGQPRYDQHRQSQYNGAPPPPLNQYYAQPPPPQRQYSNPAAEGGYVPYSHQGSQTSSQGSLQSSQYANSTPPRFSGPGGYPYGGTPNSSQTSGWSVDENNNPSRPKPQNRWHSAGYDGEGYG